MGRCVELTVKLSLSRANYCTVRIDEYWLFKLDKIGGGIVCLSWVRLMDP